MTALEGLLNHKLVFLNSKYLGGFGESNPGKITLPFNSSCQSAYIQ